MSSKADIAVRAHEESQQFPHDRNPNDSFVETPFPPTRKTYFRKRLSMTSRLGEKNPSPLSTQQSSKRSRSKYNLSLSMVYD